MSQENVEIVRRYLEEPPPEDVPLEQVLAWIAGFWESNGDYYPVRKFPEARPCHGREEIAHFFVEYRAAWHFRYVAEDATAFTGRGAAHWLGADVSDAGDPHGLPVEQTAS